MLFINLECTLVEISSLPQITICNHQAAVTRSHRIVVKVGATCLEGLLLEWVRLLVGKHIAALLVSSPLHVEMHSLP